MTAAAPAHPSQGEWDALGQKLAVVPAQANAAIEAIYTMVNDVLGQWWCPGWVADWIKPILDKLVELTKAILKQLGELLVGFAFPIVAFLVANDWNDMVKNPVKHISGEVSDANLHIGDHWQGNAATSYASAVTAQTNAMSEVDSIISDLQLRLWAVAVALIAFYIAVGTILFQWIAVLVAASAADATGIGCILGIPVEVGDTTISAAAIWALVTALSLLLGAEAVSYTTLDNRITNGSKFPNGRWPKAVTDVLRDASEKDGDDTQWHYKA